MNDIFLLITLLLMFTLLISAFIFLMFMLLSSMYSNVKGAPYVPNSSKVMKKALEFASINPGDTLIDLGSGDGKALFYSTKNIGVKSAIGYELSPYPYILSNIKKKLFYSKYNVEIVKGNMLNSDLTGGTLVYLYLFPQLMEKIEVKSKEFIEKDPKNRVVSCVFKFKNLKPYKTMKIKHPTFMKEVNIYLYQRPS